MIQPFFNEEVSAMINPAHSALSGLNAFATKLAVISNNVANVESEGFKKSRAVLNESQPAGVTVSVEEVDTPGATVTINQETGETVETSNVDLANEMVHMMTTQRYYEANLRSVKTWDEMMESVLDLFA
jgi:flagellar basal-body rod protein FlgC